GRIGLTVNQALRPLEHGREALLDKWVEIEQRFSMERGGTALEVAEALRAGDANIDPFAQAPPSAGDVNIDPLAQQPLHMPARLAPENMLLQLSLGNPHA